MTTEAAANLYRVQHDFAMDGRKAAIHNPHNKPLDALPIIYGFNNGGDPDCLRGVLIAEDGTPLGGHVCSHECYMPHDLGILEHTRPDRHERFRKHYPDGYRMEFVGYAEVPGHEGLRVALGRNAAIDAPTSNQLAAEFIMGEFDFIHGKDNWGTEFEALILRVLNRQTAATRLAGFNEAKQRAKEIARLAGCSNPECTECAGGAIAEAISAIQPQDVALNAEIRAPIKTEGK